MLKMKYLFENLDLAKMILKNWRFDVENLEKPLAHFRTSANALYTFSDSHQCYFLRLAYVDEKLKKNVFGELEFIQYLRSNQYPALKPIESKDQKAVEIVSTPWGEYFASVFECVSGIPFEQVVLNDEIMVEYGKSLGQLHLLSSEYIPKIQKWSYEDVLEWTKKILLSYPNQESALRELEDIKQNLSILPKTKATFGLVHYDFELDNVFYSDKDKTCAVIDFDDGMYNWYVLDIEQTFDSLSDCFDSDNLVKAKECFLKGYREAFPISDMMLTNLSLFRRFINLYGYARLLRSVDEQWNNEPEWLVGLRIKLSNAMNRITENFI